MKRFRKYTAAALILILAFSLLAGCSSANKAAVTDGATVPSSSSLPSSSSTYGSGVIGAAPKNEMSGSDLGAPAMPEAFAATSESKMDAAADMSGGVIVGEPLPGEIELPGGIGVEPQSGMLTAGAWSDNENFDFFKEVLSRDEWAELCDIWRLWGTSRVAVHVTDSETQSPVSGAKVRLFEGETALFSAVTDANGNAYLYYDLNGGSAVPDKVTAELGNESAELSLDGKDSAELSLKAAESGEKVLDLMFVVDTTGSMGDELEFLKEELKDVISRVSKDNAGIKIRLSVNFYRDEGDEYIVKYFAFTEDIDQALSDLREQFSSGGGDTPEAVDVALKNAVNDHEWSQDSVKLMFFVLDAPPHADRQGVPESISESIVKAAELGVRIIPVVSSGADTETELVMRTAAAVTGGVYTFLTDDSGIGYSHLEPTIGSYDVEQLNALMIRLINEYCK